MNPEYVPGPYDEYRGVVEIDFTEGLPEEVRAAIRPTRFVNDRDFADNGEGSAAPPPADAAPQPPSSASGPVPDPG